MIPRGAETIRAYADGIPAGWPAVTRHRLGEGSAWYVSTRLGGPGLDAALERACADARIAPRTGLPHDVEAVRRTGSSGTYLFVINHTDADAEVPLDAPGYTVTPAGHAASLRDVMNVVEAVPNGRGLGVVYL